MLVPKSIRYPFEAKSIAHLRHGQFWAVPLSNGRYGCGRVLYVPKPDDPQPNLYLNNRIFFAGLMDWSGDAQPTVDAIAGCNVLAQGKMHVVALQDTQGEILGYRDLALDNISGLREVSHRSGGTVWLYEGPTRLRPATVDDPHGQSICGPCAGSRFDYRCSRCGTAGRVYAAGNCYRCCVEIRLSALLGGGQGQIPGRLAPLADALLAAEKPCSVLVWLGKSPAAQLLAQLAARTDPLTHAVLDSLPPSRSVHFVRRMLMDTGVLPDRMEHLDRIVPWLDAQLESADYTQQLRRCLHDDALTTDIRTAGALILLYGIRTTDVLALRSDQVIQREHDYYLQFAGNLLVLPPPPAALLKQLPLRRRNNRSVLAGAGRTALLLFPGFTPTQQLDPGGFGARLLRYGITPHAGRNTAMITLAADLPASVLADLLGIHEVTATRWAHRTKRDWHTYLAQRRADGMDQPPPHRSEHVFE